MSGRGWFYACRTPEDVEDGVVSVFPKAAIPTFTVHRMTYSGSEYWASAADDEGLGVCEKGFAAVFGRKLPKGRLFKITLNATFEDVGPIKVVKRLHE